MAFVWSTTLETGNIVIDEQHKQLIHAINNLLAACAKGMGRAELSKTMDFLEEYTRKHFSDEEKLQIKYKYPAYLAHKKLHEGFCATVAAISTELKRDGSSTALVAKVNTCVGDWLVRHIKTEDVKLAQFLREHGN